MSEENIEAPEVVEQGPSEIELLKQEVASLKTLLSTAPKDEPVSTKPTQHEEKYAARLKHELGERYSSKLDTLGTTARIDAMEIALDTLSKVSTPLKKAEGQGINPPADLKKATQTFLQRQKAEGYHKNLRDRGSYLSVAQQLYEKK